MLQEQPVIVRGEFLHGELVGFLAADRTEGLVVLVAAVVADHESAAQVGQTEEARRCRELAAVAVVAVVEGRTDGGEQFRVLRLPELLPLAEQIPVGNPAPGPHFDHAQRRRLHVGESLAQGGQLRVERGQRLGLAEIFPAVVFLADAGRERPPHVCLRIVVALRLHGDHLLLEVHAAADCAAFPIQHLPFGVLSRVQEYVTFGPAGSVIHWVASEQHGLVSGDVADNRHDVRVGLQVVEHFAVGGKVLVRLQEVSSVYLFHFK